MSTVFGARDMPAKDKNWFIISVVLTFLGVPILIAAIVCLVLIFTRRLDWYVTILLTLLGLLCIVIGTLIQRSIAIRLDKTLK
jgi:hypothetical protein